MNPAHCSWEIMGDPKSNLNPFFIFIYNFDYGFVDVINFITCKMHCNSPAESLFFLPRDISSSGMLISRFNRERELG